MPLRKKVRPRIFPILWKLIVMLVVPTVAFASLGDNESSIQADQAQMRASVRITRTPAYAVHELRAPTGHVIREYLSPSGTVFGVAWQGPSKPDLRQLLGTHFDEFLQAAGQMERHGHGPLVIQSPDLVGVSAGHMRDFSGQDYLPRILPAGVRADDIQ